MVDDKLVKTDTYAKKEKLFPNTPLQYPPAIRQPQEVSDLIQKVIKNNKAK